LQHPKELAQEGLLVAGEAAAMHVVAVLNVERY